jgi:cystathionine beta-lyase
MTAPKPVLDQQTQDQQTRRIHHPYRPPHGFAAMVAPVHKASTVFFDSVAAMRARDWRQEDCYSYGLHGTPTTFTLAAQIADLEGGQYCLLCPSGLSAIAVVNLALLQAGDEVWLPSNAYGPAIDMAQQLMVGYGVQSRFYDPLDESSLQLTAQSKLVWLEAAGSITMEFPDLTGLIANAQAAGVLTALDNTWGAGLAFNPFALGIDLSVHALTKYPSGGGDVLMGSIVCQDNALHLQLKNIHAQLGIGIAGNDAELVLRSLSTLALRYAQQDRSARQLAHWLLARPEIVQVLHPALADSAGHDDWQQICGDTNLAAGLFSVIFDPAITQVEVDQFCDGLRLFQIGFSWGGPMSLVMPYALAHIRPMGTPHLSDGCLVRFSVGLEAVDDLIADLTQALNHCKKVPFNHSDQP